MAVVVNRYTTAIQLDLRSIEGLKGLLAASQGVVKMKGHGTIVGDERTDF
jgi:hypothetical protein